MAPRSAWRLCDAPGGASFAAAWDEALECGVARIRAGSLLRAVDGDFVPVYRRGKLVQVEHRRNDRLAIALLAGRGRIGDDYRRTAVSRNAHRLDLAALDAARSEQKRRIADADAAFRAEVDRLIERVRSGCEPRVRSL